MEALTIKVMSRNPFRILGLPGNAPAGDIAAAGARICAAAEPAQVTPTPYDTLWLGILPRNKDAIGQALVTLDNPQARLHARLFWFSSTPPQSTPSAAAHGPSGSADSLLADLIALFILAAPAPTARWAELVRRASTLAAEPAVRQSLLALECQSSPAGVEAMVDAALADFPRTIANTCFAHILGTSGIPGLIALANSLASASREPVLEPLVAFTGLLWAQIVAALDALAARLTATLRINLDRGGWHLKHDCRDETQSFERTLGPLALLLQSQGAAYPEQAPQAATTAVNILEFLADVWSILAVPDEATRLLNRALVLSADTTVEATLRAKLTQIQDSKSPRAFGRQ